VRLFGRVPRLQRTIDVTVPPALASRRPSPSRTGQPPVRRLPARTAPVVDGSVDGADDASDDGPDGVPRWIRTAGGYSWRILVIVAVVALVVFATSKIQLVFVAVFLALVASSVLRPFVDLLARVVPRALATVLALLSAFLFFAGLLAYVVNSVASQWASLTVEFSNGAGQIVAFLEDEGNRFPITITPATTTQWLDNGRTWVVDHSGALASNAIASLGSLVEVFTAIVLAVFCTVFFLARGSHMWTWFLNQLPSRSRERWHDAAGAGWYTFAGYARGTVIIALTDGMLAAIALMILGVPLAAPLAVLVFIGAFIPLIGAPLAMVIAMIVALAANGALNALAVGACIALIGQFEGHVLQPLVMGRQVSLHPVVVALAVTSGTLLAGILGAVIAVPLVAVVWAVYAKVRNLDPPLSAPPRSLKVVARSASVVP
jgi:predicted PurR-regulated permease PerM